MKRARFKVIIIVLSMLLSIFFGWATYQYQHRQPTLHGTILPSTRTLTAFDLQGTHQKVFNQQALQGHWTILFFGYTQCHSICPTTMAELHKLNVLIKKTYPLSIPLQVVMISLDPERDTIKSLGQYVKGFDTDFIGALGPKATIDAMTQQLGVVYDAQVAMGNQKTNDGQIDHSGTLTILNPEGQVVAFETPPLNAQDVAEDLVTLDRIFKRNQ